ncbi:MAG: ABC transporter permease [Chloroflexi bacterium]|nr:ABC transporter permease [Chloroflexota bacterium]
MASSVRPPARSVEVSQGLGVGTLTGRSPVWRPDLGTGAGRLMLSTLSVAVALALWQLLSTQVFASILFPSVTATLTALVVGLASGELMSQLAISLGRVVQGFLLGSLLGASLGLLMGSFGVVRKFFDPYVNFFRFITPIAWISPAVIWFGIGESSKLFLIVYATVFIVLVNTMAGVRHIHRDRVRMARCFGARAWQIFLYVTLPACVGFILTGMRIALGNSFMTVIGAEILASNNGLGYVLYSSRVFFKADVMFACILILGVLGFAADRLFAYLQHRAFGRYASGR